METHRPAIDTDQWKTVFHENFQECLNAIRAIHRSGKSSHVRHLRIIGFTGVGKSELMQEMERIHPRTEDQLGVRIPILRVEIPASPTEKTLLIEILRALGDPLPTMGTRAVMEARLYVLLKNARVELLMVDEVQHFVVNGGRVALNTCADMFKSLANKAGIPLVMLGTRSSRELFFFSSQLRSRVPLEMELRPFNWDVPEDQAMFLGVMKRQFPLGFDNDELLFNEDVAMRLWYATNGVLRSMRFFTVGLRELATESSSLTYEVMAKAFRRSLWMACPDSKNPFHADFVFRLLDGPGEPYERDRIEGGAHDKAPHVPAASLSRRIAVAIPVAIESSERAQDRGRRRSAHDESAGSN